MGYIGGINPLTNLLLTSWDIQVDLLSFNDAKRQSTPPDVFRKSSAPPTHKWTQRLGRILSWNHGLKYGGKFLQVFHSNILAGYEIDDMTCESWLHHLLGWVFGASKCRSTTRGEVLIGSWHTKGPMLRWERVTWYGGIELVLNGSSLPWLLPLRHDRITSHHIWSLQDPNQNHNEIIMNNIQVTGQLNEHLYRHQHLHITPTCL